MNGDDGSKPADLTSPTVELSEIPEEQREVIERYMAQYEMIRSPLLPPEVLRQYGEVVPGLEQKLVEWVENETSHRQKLEVDSFEEAKSLRARSQIAGPAVAIVSILAAASVAIYNPTTASASIAIVAVIVGVGGPFAARILASRFGEYHKPDQE
jgi:uncharacterized membrane protein